LIWLSVITSIFLKSQVIDFALHYFKMRGFIALSLIAAVTAGPVGHQSMHGDAAPLYESHNAEIVPNSYIIKFKKHVSDDSASGHHMWLQKIHDDREPFRMDLRKRGLLDDAFKGLKHTYKIGQDFLGYAGHFDDETIEQVRRHPDVRLTVPRYTLQASC